MIDISSNAYIKFRFNPLWKNWDKNAFIKKEKEEYYLGLYAGISGIEYYNINDLQKMNEISELIGLTVNELSIYIDCAKYTLALYGNMDSIIQENKKLKNHMEIMQSKIDEMIDRPINNVYDHSAVYESYVYLLYNEVTKLTKIGKSNDPEYRRRTLSSFEGKLDQVALFKFASSESAFVFEKNMHRVFSKKRKHGEWFDINDDDLDRIKYYYSMKDVL